MQQILANFYYFREFFNSIIFFFKSNKLAPNFHVWKNFEKFKIAYFLAQKTNVLGASYVFKQILTQELTKSTLLIRIG